MTLAYHGRILEALREAPDGLTAKALAQCVGYATQDGAALALRALRSQRKVYIDHYTGPLHGRWAAVWMLGCDEDAPKPDPVRGEGRAASNRSTQEGGRA